MLGLFLPTAVILLRDLFNNKITEEEQLEQLDIPFLGHIITSPLNEKHVALADQNSSIAESFRNIQNSLSFFLDDPSKKVITISSSLSGEGKSYCTLNLASTFALNGFKVIILEFDLRRPSIHKYLGIEPLIGLSGYLSNQALIMDVIMETSQPNLYFIPAGRIAPNPAQLIGSQKTKDLIDYLRDEFDYIFIDTAPAGIISETFNLIKISDFGLIIVKSNYTVKQALVNTLKSFASKGITNIGTILNGINIVKSTYKYKYSSNYYSNPRSGKGLKKKLRKNQTIE
jgi:capsular exopolysaccharide synthesis family protein